MRKYGRKKRGMTLMVAILTSLMMLSLWGCGAVSDKAYVVNTLMNSLLPLDTVVHVPLVDKVDCVVFGEGLPY